ncbi:MAG: hypothetical protein BWY73_01115 [candidate division TA06 bacterium ADurb.Bin417]|uniref:Uncharacterized protein n=1 Tax=candidate division TA06 bacterium ADurb.Bin417 TaxID=1852828 RepID=A0A1V5MDQ0_UNCT6|nr:MAG: hypothetical protein BWY73_01115 [candidate division TA06 bacterium ADurb.Bin417]
MKVLWPRLMSSWTPMRVKIRSTRPTRARPAGTAAPIWAMITSSAACLI